MIFNLKLIAHCVIHFCCLSAAYSSFYMYVNPRGIAHNRVNMDMNICVNMYVYAGDNSRQLMPLQILEFDNVHTSKSVHNCACEIFFRLFMTQRRPFYDCKLTVHTAINSKLNCRMITWNYWAEWKKSCGAYRKQHNYYTQAYWLRCFHFSCKCRMTADWANWKL